MAQKYSLGLGLTPGRPNLNYIAVFSQACQSHYSGGTPRARDPRP
jgi:hypothetical protein